jgi:hypothetical protein
LLPSFNLQQGLRGLVNTYTAEKTESKTYDFIRIKQYNKYRVVISTDYMLLLPVGSFIIFT